MSLPNSTEEHAELEDAAKKKEEGTNLRSVMSAASLATLGGQGGLVHLFSLEPRRYPCRLFSRHLRITRPLLSPVTTCKSSSSSHARWQGGALDARLEQCLEVMGPTPQMQRHLYRSLSPMSESRMLYTSCEITHSRPWSSLRGVRRKALTEQAASKTKPMRPWRRACGKQRHGVCTSKSAKKLRKPRLKTAKPSRTHLRKLRRRITQRP